MIQVEITHRKADSNLIEGVGRFLRDLSVNEFYGVVEIQFVGGEIILVRKQESFKPQAFLVVE